MYKGTIKNYERPIYVFPKEIEIVELQQEEYNGIITENYVTKIKELVNNPDISVRDFDIKNLQATGAINQLKPTQLSTPIDKIEKNAATANKVLEQIDIIKELENGQSNKTPTESN